MNKEKSSVSPVLKLLPLHRLFFSLAVAAAIFFLMRSYEPKPLVLAIGIWIGFAFTYLILDWVIIFKRNVNQIRKRARQDDGSTAYVFFIVLTASFASMFAVLFLTISKEKSDMLTVAATVAAMMLSWIMVHTQYVFHYAHEYYDEDDKGNSEQAGGIDFPGSEDPDYLDFAYFSFCLGSTFQVSDVEISEKNIRRTVLVHGLISFFMNTFVVALTINLIAGLSNS